MKAKLIKVTDDIGVYYVLNGSNLPENYVLSDKNCQAIERGYDLDELAYDFSWNYQSDPNYGDTIHVFKAGFQKALELMGDKKFSEEDMIKFSEYCLNNNDCFSDLNDNLSKFQSLQQTEWDVEIEMEGPLVYPANLPKEGEERPAYRPKLDAYGNLILKRI